MNSRTRVALYGGAFNPPHLAHIFTVTYLLGRDDIDEVWLIPTAEHVFGKDMAPVSARIELVEDVIAAYDWTRRVRVLDVETRREGPSRTFDTLSQLQSDWPDHELRWVMGADNLTERHRWYRFDDLVSRWDLIVLGRPGHEAALDQCAPEHWCHPGPTLPSISSTELRDAIGGIGPTSRLAWLPDCIHEKSQRLYQRDGSSAPTVTILGLGRLGQTWDRCLKDGGQSPRTWNRTCPDTGSATDDLPRSIDTDVVLITVSDTAIATVANQLAEHLSDTSRPVVLHCAGRLGSSVLEPLSRLGCPVGSLHPLQSVQGGASDLYGAYCVVSGDDDAVLMALKLVDAAGARAVHLPTNDKAAYHAAAVLSANFITTLAHSGAELLESLGLSHGQATQLLVPLAMGTVQHLQNRSPAEALTGPFARYDLVAIAAHTQALSTHAPHLLETYRALARVTALMMSWSDEEVMDLEQAISR
jgi:nicotinate (nicotinamide) nucleotide adenylyltransferase